MKKNRSEIEMDIFSVYIFIFKNIHGLKKTIESIYMQSYKNIELIISDDHSIEDDEKQYRMISDIVEPYKTRFSDVIVNVNKENMGTVKHINKMLPMGTGKYITLLGSGDGLYRGDVLQNVANHFKKGQSLVCTSRRIMHYSEGKHIVLPSKRVCKYFYKDSKHLLNLCCREINYLVTIGSFFRRDIFEIYGCFDENYVLLEDAPFFLKLLFCGEKITFIDDITCFYEKGGVSNRKKMDKRLLEDSKKTLKLIKYPNRDRLGFFTSRIVSLKYSLRISGKKMEKIGSCILYPDAVLYMCIFVLLDKILKSKYLE